MKKVFTTLTLFSIIFFSATYFETGNELQGHASGAPSGKTGSPGDNSSCTSCHSGNATVVTGIITSTIPVAGYEPGLTYVVTATCTDATVYKWGFEISPQNVSGTKIGTMILTNTTTTRLLSSGKYITQTISGTGGAGTITWSFNWTAPPAGTGDFSFYGAFLFTNSNNASSGDRTKLSQLNVTENRGTLVDFISKSDQINVWPNPVSEVAHFSIPEMTHINSIQVLNSAGKLVKEVTNLEPSDNFEMNVSGFSSGIYYLSFATEKGTYSGRLIKM